MAQFLGQLASDLIEKELAAGELKVLLGERSGTFEASVDERGWTCHDLLRIIDCEFLLQLLFDAGLIVTLEGRNLASLAVVE